MLRVRLLRQRRAFLAALGREWASPLLLAASLAFGAAPALGQTAVKFSLDGPVEGVDALFLFPQDKGYFRSEGLEVTIDEAASALDPIKRVASGAYELGFADFNGLIRYRDAHPAAPVRPIFVVYNKPAYAVVARKSRGISEPKQIENKRIGAQAGGSSFAEWPLFAKLNGIDVSKVTIENTALAVRVPMLAAGQIDGALGASFRLYIDLKDRGVPVDDIVLMGMAEYGMNLYGNVIIVNSKFAGEKPDEVKRFLQALTRGLKEVIRRPDEAVDSILKRNDAAKKDVELERLRMMIGQNIVTPEVSAHGLGAVEPARMDDSLNQLALVYTFKNRPKPQDVFDPSFLPPAAERKLH